MNRIVRFASSDRLLPLVGVFGLIAIWYIGYWSRIVDPVLLPPPHAALKALWNGFTGGRLLYDFWQTVIRTFAATAVAGIIAIPLGIVLGSSERIYRSVEFVVDFFRSTPASALFPLFLVIFGVGNATKIYVASFGAALVILFNVAYGVMNARKTRILAARVMGAQRGGSIINMSSRMGLHGYPMRTAYCATKFALIGMTEAVAREIGPMGVRVNALCPGAVSGELMDRVIARRAAVEGRPAEQIIKEAYTDSAALRRWLSPEEVATAALFLASDASSAITGERIKVDCGRF